MTSELKLYLNDVQWVISAAKEQLGLKITEEKDAMSFEAYGILAKTLFSARRREIFSTISFLCSIGI